MKKKVLSVLAVICILLIWMQSAMPGEVSSQESGWVTEEVINPPLQRFTGKTVTELFVRKCAHVFEFTALSILLFLCFNENKVRTIFTGWLVAFLDETVQLISHRGAMIQDVWIDMCGVITGTAIVWALTFLWRKRSPQR